VKKKLIIFIFTLLMSVNVFSADIVLRHTNEKYTYTLTNQAKYGNLPYIAEILVGGHTVEVIELYRGETYKIKFKRQFTFSGIKIYRTYDRAYKYGMRLVAYLPLEPFNIQVTREYSK